MALIPEIQLPWTRKTPIQRAQAELRKVQKDIETQVDKAELPKVDTKEIGAAVEDTARAAAHGVEQIAGQVAVAAGKIGREAGKAGRKAGKRGRELSQDLARSGEEGIRGLSHDLGALGDDVRSLRITRKKRGPNMLPGIALLAGLSGGLAAMYFFDPEQGARRRALLRDQIVKWSRITSERVEGQAKDLRNRSAGLVHEVRRAVEGSDDGGMVEEAIDAVAETTPDATADLAATDQASGRRRKSSARSTSTTAESTSPVAQSTAVATEPPTEGDVRPAATGRQENIYGAFGEVASETWGEPQVPEAKEGQPDLKRRS
jgi:hypothetical protein